MPAYPASASSRSAASSSASSAAARAGVFAAAGTAVAAGLSASMTSPSPVMSGAQRTRLVVRLSHLTKFGDGCQDRQERPGKEGVEPRDPLRPRGGERGDEPVQFGV